MGGRWCGARIGLAKLRRDGWVVARPEPGADEAWIVTKPMDLQGHELLHKADPAADRVNPPSSPKWRKKVD